MNDNNDAKTLPEVIQGNYDVSVGEFFSQGWQLLQKNIVGFIGYVLLLVILNFVLQQIPKLGPLATFILNPILFAGLFIVAFKLLQEKSTSFGDFFQGYKNWIHLILGSIVSSILIGIGTILLIIPGIYLSTSYIFSLPIIIDRQTNFWDAMEASRKIITKKWFSWFGFLLLLGIINLVGALIVGIGMLVTIPFTFCAIAVAYQQVVGLQNQDF